MKVLILGGQGMLAYALKQVFCFQKVLAPSHQECDITDPGLVATYMSTLAPDLVINCAAYTDVDMAQTNPVDCELVNATAVKWLAEACWKRQAPLVHFSTEMVFGQEDQFGYEEIREPRYPFNVYGRTKLDGERLLRETWGDHWVVRTSWLFGPGRNNFVDYVLREAKKKPVINIVGDQTASPTYTFDLARAVYDLVQERAPFGTYHLTNDGSASKATFAKEIIDHTVGDCRVNVVSSKQILTLSRRPQYGVLLNTKRPKLRPWSEAMVEYLIGMGEMFGF